MKLTNTLIAQAPSPSQQSSSQSGVNYQIPTGITLAVLLITVSVQLFTAIFTAFKSWKDLSNQQRLFIEGQNLKERDDIRYKLNNFFGPMRELRAESRILYDVFALKEKEEAEKSGSYFRTVTHLTEGKPFSEQDQALLKEIIELGKKQLELIEKEGWAVTNLHLTELLGELGAHIRIMVMAYESKLNGMSGEIKKLVFPLEIDGALETEIRKLQDRYSDLLRDSTNERASKHDEELSKTIGYYNENHLEYYKQTAFINLSDIYREFRRCVPRGALVLDAGCGVGRDTRYFIKRGYRVVSFDAAHEMVKSCRQYPFAYCIRRFFDEITFVEEFDAVWACASLIHLPYPKLNEAIFNLFSAVKPGGIIYFSLKMKNRDEKLSEVVTGRRFYYYSLEEVSEIAESSLALEPIKVWTNQSRKESDPTEWSNFLYRKPRSAPPIKDS